MFGTRLGSGATFLWEGAFREDDFFTGAEDWDSFAVVGCASGTGMAEADSVRDALERLRDTGAGTVGEGCEGRTAAAEGGSVPADTRRRFCDVGGTVGPCVGSKATSPCGAGVATVELDGSDSIDASVRFRAARAGATDGSGARKQRGADRINAGRGAGSGLVVMEMVAAERSGFGGGVDVLFGLIGFRGS